VVPARFGLTDIVAHVVVHALVEPATPAFVALASQPGLPGIEPEVEPEAVFCYDIELLDQLERRAGKASLVAGTVRVRSRLTYEEDLLRFAGLHLGEHHMVGGVRSQVGDAEWAKITTALAQAFLTADLLAAQRTLDRSFPDGTVSLGSLRGADRDQLVSKILAEPLAQVDEALERIYDEYAPLMRWLETHHLTVPEAIHTAAEYTLRRRLLHNLMAASPSFPEVLAQITEAAQVEVTLDTPEVAYAAGIALGRVVDRLVARPDDITALEAAARAADVASRMRSPVDLWHAQNACMRLVEQRLIAWRTAGDPASTTKARWLTQLANALRLATPS
jgi:hypothetical protein